MKLDTPAFSRRTFLRGVGACIALPTLDSLFSGGKLRAAGAAVGKNAPLAVTGSGMPLRMAFIQFANGANQERWAPKGEGREFVLNETFAPMQELKDKFQIISNLHHNQAKNLGDGPGDHARAGAAFLTGVHAWKTLGAKLKLGVSVDQVAAEQIGHLTRIDSLQLGTEPSRLYGSCDTGYPCAYQYNLSWASETTPLPPEVNPRLVFERLFGNADAGGAAEAAARLARRKSVLDFVLDDVNRLNQRLGRNDRAKVDEYLGAVRKLEQQIEKAERFRTPTSGGRAAPDESTSDHKEHVEIMYELIALAFQTDSTRIVTFPVAWEGSNRPFLELDIPEGHHYLTHHSGNQEKILKVAKIEKWYMERFAHFVRRLDAMKEPDGTSVLHNSMIVYGSAVGDGNRHNHDELPVVLAGRGGGAVHAGRHFQLRDSTPMTNLYLAMLDRMGVPARQIGDSTGRLENV
jgi:hypothetical protein